MNNSTKNDIKTLFSNLCCSRCKNDFTEESVEILESNNDLLICKLTCKKCAKDFGNVVFNYNKKSKAHHPLDIIEGPAPITADDVIDAHNYIKKFM